MLNYSDLVITDEISPRNWGFSHVYRGEYKSEDVAIKIYDKDQVKRLKYKLYGIQDIYALEYQNLLETLARCPELKENVQEPIGICKRNDIGVLVTKLVLDEDGSVSSRLDQSKNLVDEKFIKELKDVLYILGDKGIYHMQIEDQHNILVRINSGIHPLIIDFQNINEQYYPWLKLTKHLAIDSAKERYFRRVNRLIRSLQ